jgi:hypothetical protein
MVQLERYGCTRFTAQVLSRNVEVLNLAMKAVGVIWLCTNGNWLCRYHSLEQETGVLLTVNEIAPFQNQVAQTAGEVAEN